MSRIVCGDGKVERICIFFFINKKEAISEYEYHNIIFIV